MTSFVQAVTARTTGRRVPLSQLWDAFAAVAPVDAAASDARSRLAAAITAGQDTGAWTCAKKTDRAGRPPLPAFITLPAPETAARPDPTTVAWRPALAWAARLPRLNPTQLQMLVAVNAFLRDGGEHRPLVPSEERSLELFNDEKAISGHVGGTTLWQPGRLTYDLLRCVPSTTPFAYEQVGTGDRLLVVENQATFATVRDLLRTEPDHPYAAVVFGAGRHITATISYLTALPFRVVAVDYFGDLDVDGLETAAACLDAARHAGVEARLHRPLWQLLLDQPPTPASKPPNVARAAQAAAVLPAGLRSRATAILTDGQRIAQERCGTELLAVTSGWWHPDS